MDYLNLPEIEAESTIFARLNDYDEEERLRYAQIGLMVLSVNRRQLWKHRFDIADGFPCRSFARWIRIACPYSYSTVYAALKDVAELSDVPADDLAQIPQGNFRTMKQLSTAVRRDPKVIEAAKGRTGDFVAMVKKSHPDQHLEAETIFRVPLNETQMADVEGALAKAMARGCESRSQALWMIAVDFISTDDTPLADVEDGKCGHA
jgi:hypothetical protein